MPDPNPSQELPAGLQCGDCRSSVSGPPSAAANDDYYCPRCAQPKPDSITCRACGSTICPDCGTPLEQADDLGIG